jgi:HAD superfamily hydrolase (TIGR01509 family)
MGWPGQFNLDFAFMLLLGATWVAKRRAPFGAGLCHDVSRWSQTALKQARASLFIDTRSALMNRLRNRMMATIKALIFGSIGTITETSDRQREAFNAAFREHGLDWTWDEAEYRTMISGDRMTVGGGARIAEFAQSRGTAIDDARANAIHETKTRVFQERMTRDGLPLNPGVDALLSEAKDRGLKTVFASTTARTSIDAMLRAAVPSLDGRFDYVMSRDDVARAKPSPDIYVAVLERLNLDAGEVIAIEDSAPSLSAALAAGIATYVVPGKLWRGARFEGASGVIESLEGVGLDALAAPLGREVGNVEAVAG